MTDKFNVLPDQPQRDMIETELKTSMLVEAAAGTGKTTAMVGRMIALLREGECEIEKIAAITFTRKAAAEMRNKFQTKLEEEARNTGGIAAERLQCAAENAGKCYIGTIHSFCARLLRERPVEAQVPLEFEQIEEDVDQRFRLEAWDDYCSHLYAQDTGGILTKMDDLGMSIGDLREGFVKFADYPDVHKWPVEPDGPLPDTDDIRSQILAHVQYIQREILPLPEESGTDKIIPLYRKLSFLFNKTDWGNLASIERFLSNFDKKSIPTTARKYWPGNTNEKKSEILESEKERWLTIRNTVAHPFQKRLQEHRYKIAMEVFHNARKRYDALRYNNKMLNFQDLLMNAAKLLRSGGEHIRRYFQNRLSHLLVDEFQDTDPIQAEVMLLLTAQDLGETHWQKCSPKPGSLFIVGDPKQSIYRFRRADLVTYNAVKKQIEAGNGKVLTLSANFRSLEPVLDWVNKCFGSRFETKEEKYSPSYVHLSAGKKLKVEKPVECIETLTIPDEFSKKEDIRAYEPKKIALAIKNALEKNVTIQCPKEKGRARPVKSSDFMIVTWKKEGMSAYAKELDRLGIPNSVTGGTVLNEVPQLRQLYNYLSALVHPHNPVMLIAALRGELFGIDDPTLYAFKKAGGIFDWRKNVPERLGKKKREWLESIFETFKENNRLISRMPPVAAIERISQNLGLNVSAAASTGGNVQAGSLGKALEILRSVRSQYWTISQLVEHLGEIVRSEDKHDGIPARALSEQPVRIMNLHKVKGLQAPVVFLADPNGKPNNKIDFHIDRESRDAVYGFLTISKSSGYQKTMIARPPGWDEKEEEEMKFMEAENDRLLYVAATRAASKIVISRREKGNHHNPWQDLTENADNCSEFTLWESDKEKLFAATEKTEAIQNTDQQKTDIRPDWGKIKSRRNALLTASYQRRQARPKLGKPAENIGHEYGMERGNVLHSLLEVKMRDPEADLTSLAISAGRHENLPRSSIKEAVETVEALAEHENGILARARRSRRFLTEVPFSYMETPDGDKQPALVNGTIDLAFEENDGWVLVDYKTDKSAVDTDGRKRLTEHYKPQILNYVRAWRKCVGDNVKEAGFYFTAAPQYVLVDLEVENC